MKFEQAMLAMRKGYKVQRKSLKERLNAVCLFMKDGLLYSEQTHPLNMHKVERIYGVSYNAILAEDWIALEKK